MRLIESNGSQQIWDVFVLPDETPEIVLAKLSKRLRRLVKSYGKGEAEIETLEVIPPANCPNDHPLVAALVMGALEATGRSPHVGQLSACTGMSLIQERLKIPVVAFGYGRIDLCHTPDEWVSVTQVISTAKAYAVAMSRMGSA